MTKIECTSLRVKRHGYTNYTIVADEVGDAPGGFEVVDAYEVRINGTRAEICGSIMPEAGTIVVNNDGGCVNIILGGGDECR
jgi:hypothetical protein